MVTSGKVLTDLRKSALTAGISLIIMALAAFFSYGYVHESLLVQGDARATLQNIISQNMLFKAEIFGWIIILICDIVVAWSFYIFLKPMNRNLSLLGAWLRLTYTTILGIAIMNLIFVLLLSNNTDDLSLLTTKQLQVQVMLYLKAFDSIWSIGLIIFGGHLLIVGWVALKSGSIPKLISILLLIAAIGYIVIHLCNTILPQDHWIITILEFVFTVPMIVGELGFGLWLLFRGGKVTAKV